MAAFDFPNSPSNGDVYNAPNGKQYTYNSANSCWRGGTVLGAQGHQGHQGVLGAQGAQGAPAAGVNGKIINVWSDLKSTADSTVNQSWTDISGLDITLTPASANSKFIIIASANLGYSGGTHDAFIRLVRVIGGTTTAIGNGTGASSGANHEMFGQISGQNGHYQMEHVGVTFRDTPNTTSSILYKLQFRSGNHTVYINRRGAVDDFRGSSTITVMELQS